MRAKENIKASVDIQSSKSPPSSPILTSKPAKRSSSLSVDISNDGVESTEDILPTRKKLCSLNPWNDPYVFRFDDEAVVPHSPPSLPSSPRLIITPSVSQPDNKIPLNDIEGDKNEPNLADVPTEAMLEVINRTKTKPAPKRGRPPKCKTSNTPVIDNPTPAMQIILEKKSRNATKKK